MDEQNIKIGMTKSSLLLEKLSSWVLLLMVFLVPIFFLPVTFISIQFVTSLLFAAAVIISLVLFIVLRLKEGSLEMPKSTIKFIVFFCLVPVVYVLSFIVSGISRTKFLGYTFDESTVGFVLLSFMFAFLVMMLFRKRERIFYSYITIVISSLLCALFLLSRIIFGVDFLSFGIFTDLTSTVVGSWSSLGIFFGISTILSVLSLEMLSLHKAMKWLVILALICSLFFLAIVNFRAIWIIMGAVSILVILYKIFSVETFSNDSWKERLKKTPLFPGVVLIVSIVFMVTPLGQRIADFSKISSIEVRPGIQATYDIFTKTIQSSPIFGSGANTFQQQWLSYKPIDINTTAFWNTDFPYGVGLIPTFAVTTGLLGVFSWILFFGLFIYLGFKSIFIRSTDIFSKYLSVSSFFISLYLWIMAFIYVPSLSVFILTFFFTGLFFAGASHEQLMEIKTISFGNRPKLGFGISLVLISFLVSSLALGYFLYSNSTSLFYFQKGLYAANTKGDLVAADTYINKAVARVPYDIYYRAQTEIALQNITSLLSQDLSKADINKVSTQFSTELTKAISAALNAKAADANNYLNWLELGKAYEFGVPAQTRIPGAYDSSKAAFLQAQILNPQNPFINLSLAQLEMNNDNKVNAEKYASAAIKQKPNYLDAYFLLAQLQAANGNIPAAITSVTAATQIDPNNPNIYFQLGLLYYNQSDWNNAGASFEQALKLAPEYANAKYFLGLAFAQIKDYASAAILFEDLKKTNPDNKDVDFILTNLRAGKSPFTDAKPPINTTPEKGSSLPLPENQ